MPRKHVSVTQDVCLPAERIERSILIIRGERVMLDADLAELYGVETRALVQAVKRNTERFPPDFAFELTPEEFNALRSQFVISKRGGRRYLPYASRPSSMRSARHRGDRGTARAGLRSRQGGES